MVEAPLDNTIQEMFEEIQELFTVNTTTKNIQELLQRLPGVTVYGNPGNPENPGRVSFGIKNDGYEGTAFALFEYNGFHPHGDLGIYSDNFEPFPEKFIEDVAAAMKDKYKGSLMVEPDEQYLLEWLNLFLPESELHYS